MSSSAMLSVRGSSARRLAPRTGSSRQRPAAISSASAGGAAPTARAVESAASERLGGRRGVADDAEVDRPVGADRLLVAVDLDDRARRVPSACRGASSTGSARRRRRSPRRPRRSSRAAVGDEKPPAMPTAYGSPGEQAVGRRAEVASIAPVVLAEPPQRRPGAGQHRAAAGDDRGPLGAARSRSAAAVDGRRRRAAAGASSASGGGGAELAASAACTSSGSISTTARRSTRARRTARATSAIAVCRARARARPTAPTASTRPAWSIRKFERSAAAGVSAASSSSGVRLLAASVSPVIVFVSPGPWWTLQTGEPPAHARVAVGHADRAALVAGGDEARAGVAQRVGDRQVAAAEQPEDGVDAEGGQRPADRLGDQHRRQRSAWDVTRDAIRSRPAAARTRRSPRRPPRAARGAGCARRGPRAAAPARARAPRCGRAARGSPYGSSAPWMSSVGAVTACRVGLEAPVAEGGIQPDVAPAAEGGVGVVVVAGHARAQLALPRTRGASRGSPRPSTSSTKTCGASRARPLTGWRAAWTSAIEAPSLWPTSSGSGASSWASSAGSTS